MYCKKIYWKIKKIMKYKKKNPFTTRSMFLEFVHQIMGLSLTRQAHDLMKEFKRH
jgi:hypothetical protein